MAFCVHCGTQLPDNSVFCTQCGKKQTPVYHQTFRRENLSEDQFIAKINWWFAQYPQVANVKGEFLTHNGIGVFVNKYVLDAFSIEYELLDGVNTNQYAVALLDQSALYEKTTDSLLNQWKAQNPGAVLLKRHGGTHQRGSTGSLLLGGIGAVNRTQLYVFYKFNRETGPAALPASK